MAFTGNEDHSITLEEAAKLTKNYRDKAEPDAIRGGFFGKTALLKILNQAGCVGLRIYFGAKADGTPELVLVGVDSKENDILTKGEIAERQFPCPPRCGEDNQLNS